MNTPQMIGWGAWALLVVFATGWTIGCYRIYKSGAGLNHATLNTTIVWWFFLGATHLFSINKLHLFWLAPSVIPVAAFIALWIASLSMRGALIHPLLDGSGIYPLLGGYGLVLWWLAS